MAIGTPNLQTAVDRALERASTLGVKLGDLTRQVRASSPDELNSPQQKRQRREFLESQYDESREADQAYERIIDGNELQDASYLARGALVCRPVMRVVLRTSGGSVRGYATGFLIGDRVLLTNNHVFGSSDEARNADGEAFYERGLIGEEVATRTFAFDPDSLFYTSKDLDFSVVAVGETDRTGTASLRDLGWLPLIGVPGKAMEGEWLTILQHPKGERKQLCVRENQLLKCDTEVLWYSTDTLGGSSGSPVFNNDWMVVALHHSGVPEIKDGKWQTVDGRDYDSSRDSEDQIKWKANEGIRISRIMETLRSDNAIANNKLIKPILELSFGDLRARLPVAFRAGYRPTETFPPITPFMLGLRGPGTPALDPNPIAPAAPAPKESDMSRRVTVTLEMDDDGNVSLIGGGAEADLIEAATTKKKKNLIFAPVVPAEDWVVGYREDFLIDPAHPDANLIVPLPRVREADVIAPIIDQDYAGRLSEDERAQGVLKYNRYSVIMNADRRFAFFSAANVDGGMRPHVSGRNDNWLVDERISRKHQVDGSYYTNNKFDRGHLTRREDMEWGDSPKEAVRRANGTCTWTNCTPQQAMFNQGKDKSVLLWQQLEQYILEQSAERDQFRAQVITGPVLGAGDPVYRNIPYPLEFWKVVAAVDSDGNLFATAYLLSQKATIDKFGVEAAVVEPFGQFGTYQVAISEIENLTGLEFMCGPADHRQSLSTVDPLRPEASAEMRRRRRLAGASTTEAFGVASNGALQSLEDIVLA